MTVAELIIALAAFDFDAPVTIEREQWDELGLDRPLVHSVELSEGKVVVSP